MLYSKRHLPDIEPEQWLQPLPEAGSSWPSWPQASPPPRLVQPRFFDEQLGSAVGVIDYVIGSGERLLTSIPL